VPETPPPAPEPAEPVPEAVPEPEPEPEPPVAVEQPPEGPTAEERYAELRQRVDAARQSALDENADEVNPDEFMAAENSADAGFTDADNGDYDGANTNLEQAVVLYEQAAQNAAAEWNRRIALAKQEADQQKTVADGEKAGNAAKTEYLDADRSYQNAARAQTRKDYRTAIAEYEAAARQFALAAEIAATKRAAAAAALLAAENKVAESDELAAEIEQTLIDEGAEL
jgi:colicin import membrane protein